MTQPSHAYVEKLDKELGEATKYADVKCMHKYFEIATILRWPQQR